MSAHNHTSYRGMHIPHSSSSREIEVHHGHHHHLQHRHNNNDDSDSPEEQLERESREYVIARLPLEMYRRRREEDDEYKDDDNDQEPYPDHAQQTQIIELCFHPSFEPRPYSPVSLHFETQRNVNTVVSVCDPPPPIPELEPPSFAIEFNTVRLYLDPPSSGLSRVFLRPWRRKIINWWHDRPDGIDYISICVLIASTFFLLSLPWIMPSCAPHGVDQTKLPQSTSPPPQDGGVPSEEWSLHTFPFDIEEMMMSWSVVIPTGLLGMKGPFRRPTLGDDALRPQVSIVKVWGGEYEYIGEGLDKTEQERCRSIDANFDWGPDSWAWSIETTRLMPHDNITTKEAWVHTIAKAPDSDRSTPLKNIEMLLIELCNIGRVALAWGENYSQQGNGGGGDDDDDDDNTKTRSKHQTIPTHTELKRKCRAVETHLQKARGRAWPSTLVSAAYMASDARGHVSKLVEALESILKSTLLRRESSITRPEDMNLISRFTPLDYRDLAVSWQQTFAMQRDVVLAAYDDEPGNDERERLYSAALWKVGPLLLEEEEQQQHQRFSTLASRIVEAFYKELITAAILDDGTSQYGGQEAWFLAKMCQDAQKGDTKEQHPGCGLTRASRHENDDHIVSSAAAWDAWVKILWDEDTAIGREEDLESEPSLVALVRHLTSAMYLIEQINDMISRIPQSWITTTSEAAGQKYTIRTSTTVDNKDNNNKNGWWKQGWRFFAEKQTHTQKREISTLEVLEILTQNLNHLRKTILEQQKNVAVTSLDAMMEAHRRWHRLRMLLEDGLKSLRSPLVSGMGTGTEKDDWWWTTEHDDENNTQQTRRRRRKLPTPKMLVHLLWPLEEKLARWETATEDFFSLVTKSRILSENFETATKAKMAHEKEEDEEVQDW